MLVKKHPHGEYFSRAPDKNSKLHKLMCGPDYIDLSMVENNFKTGYYSTTDGFLQDIGRIWSNSNKLKTNEQNISQKALELKLFFELQVQTLAIPEGQSVRDGTFQK